MIKNRYAAFGLFVVVFVLFFNLLDFMYTAWIAGGTYRFSAGLDLGVPLLPGLILGYVLFLHKKSPDRRREDQDKEATHHGV